MELVEGDDLAAHRAGAIPIDEALTIASRSPRPSKRRTSRASSTGI